MRRVVFLVQPQVCLLDLAGPAEVFHTARDYGLPYELSYVADEPEIITAELLPVRTSTTWPTLSPNDIIIVPGRQCATLEDISPSERALAMLRSHHRQGGMVVSVCAATEPLRLAELSRKFGCSERAITRRFRDATGLTPMRYQQALRLERAEHLIASGTTVEGAARAVGFSDSRTLRALRAAARTAAGV